MNSYAIVDEKCHSIVFTPAYQSVQQAPFHAGSEITKIRLDPDSGWQIDPDQVEAAIKPNTKYMVFNEPFNPAGTLMSHKSQARLKELAETNGIYILSDEVYRLLEHDEKDRLPAMADFYDKGISAVTL